MGQDLVEIQPRELRFTFELKKQSSCSVHLTNKSDDHVAFKVKTTSPKRYCVRPNTGVIPPRSSFDFTVTMLAQRTAPSDMQIKDKFLVQTTVVPYGTTEEEIAPDFFSKEQGRYVEESKLKVVLTIVSDSPALQITNETLDPEPDFETPAMEEAPIFVKEAPVVVESPVLDPPKAPSPAVLKEFPIIEPPKAPVVVGESLTTYNEYSAIPTESPVSTDKPLNKLDNLYLSHVTEDDNLKSKLSNLESKLNEAEKMIARLRAESKTTIQQRDTLQKELVLLRRNPAGRTQVGFPLLFVVYVALVGMLFGYLMHP